MDVYGISSISKLVSFVINIIVVITNPINPIVVAASMKMNLHILIPFTTSISVNNNPLTLVIATTIITIGDTIPALTAASPSTNAPTIDTAAPIWFGSLMSDSLSISNVISINVVSITVGNGTPCLCIAIDINKLSGIISKLYVVSAMYSAGVNRVIINPRNLSILVIVIFIGCW